MRILIIKLSSIGDVIHTLPSLYSLRKAFEKKGVRARIDWLVEEAASGVIIGHPLIDDVIIAKRGWRKNLRQNLALSGRIAARRYDLVLDFQGLLKSGVWVFLSKGKRKIGFRNAREMSRLFYNEKLPAYDPDRHAVDRYLDLARHAAGIKDGGPPVAFTLNTGKDDRKRAARVLKSSGLPEGAQFFVMVTRARWSTKLWRDEKFIELGKKLVESAGLYAVLAGSPGDKLALDSIKKGIGEKCVNLAGQTGLKELAEMFRLSKFVVTLDSGPMHLAAAAGARVVALFGPTAPWRTGPYGKGHTIIRKGLECSPCFKRKCKDPKCMADITVEEVLSAVEAVLMDAGKERTR